MEFPGVVRAKDADLLAVVARKLSQPGLVLEPGRAVYLNEALEKREAFGTAGATRPDLAMEEIRISGMKHPSRFLLIPRAPADCDSAVAMRMAHEWNEKQVR